MRLVLVLAMLPWLMSTTLASAAGITLVDDGQARAEIIIAESPQRTVRLAAYELQTYVEKISGAKLAIATKPTAGVPVQVYIGRSAHTDRLKITADGLRYGAYRIASGESWLAIIGDDTDFKPIEPWAASNGDIASGKLQAEWSKITGAHWGAPNPGMYKNRITLPGEIGQPTAQAAAGKAEPWQLWSFDERGSYNGVCGLLQKLGVRWYLPGELGEVVPKTKTIVVPQLDETVHPDFPSRRFNFRFATCGRETAMWAMRLGIREPNGQQTAHGMHTMTHRDELFAAHPEWYALYGGKRHTQTGQRLNQLCYSNEELFQETVRFVRAQFDHYKYEAVSVMPPDGYTSICQCKLCEGKDSPDRDNRGLLSNYVWDFVNRVAKEVRKTHPDRFVSNAAYGTYTLPPQNIDKLEPNVLVIIVGGRRPTNNKPEQQEEIRRLREAWAAKTDNPLLIFENYPFTDRGWYLPAFVSHTLGAGINATKGMSQGEDIWLTIRSDFDKVDIGFNHFMVYFTARVYWGGKGQDVDAMLTEYCRLFYGPAEQSMRAFFDYCEVNWQEMEKDKSKVDRALELFAAAQQTVTSDSVYAKRIALIDDFLKGLRSKSGQLGKRRGPVPKLRLVGDSRGSIKIDGKFDDAAWQECPVSSTGSLRELQTGGLPTFGTTIKTAWIGNDLYFAIRCDERRGEKLNIAATKDDDSALWYGDAVEVLLETDARSYYQIAVSPSGAVVDLDRSAARAAWFSWDSLAEVATQIADDHWTVEMRIPVTQDENDPLHQVIGRRPTTSLPWHINVCRQRIRENGQEASAFSPTGANHFHNIMKFAHFYGGRSHEFEHAAPDDDFLEASRTATALLTQRKHEAAIATFTAIAEGKYTDQQKSHALEQAAASASLLKDYALADKLADRITIPAVAKNVRMNNLLAQRQWPELVRQFGQEEIAAWPFWKAGDGYFTRGRALVETGAGVEAEADLVRALEFTSDARTRLDMYLALGRNREMNLKDDARALEAYRQLLTVTSQKGVSSYYTGLLAAARILRKGGEFDASLTMLRTIEIEHLRGVWRGSVLLAIAETLQAAGRKTEAITAYQGIADDEWVEPSQRQAAEKAVKSLQSSS
jgi:tetratricopeptide (TPR) repeat protein